MNHFEKIQIRTITIPALGRETATVVRRMQGTLMHELLWKGPRVFGALAVLALLSAGMLAAQEAGRIAGEVRGTDGSPVTGAEVRVPAANTQGITAANGQFQIRNVPAGSYELQVYSLGYRDTTVQVEVTAGEVATVDVELELRPVEIRGVQVHVLRPDLQHTTQLEADAVRERNPRDAGEALRGLQGVDAVRRGPVGMDPVVRGLRETEVGTYMNGTRLFPAGPARMDSPLTHLDPSAIQHVEVVKGPYALTWGAGNLAAIRVDTRGIPPQVPGPFHGTLISGYDANLGAQEYSGSAFGSNDRLAYWAHGVWRDGDDYEAGNGSTVPADFNSWEGRGRVGYRTGEASWANVSVGYQEQGPIDYPGRLLNADFFETVNLSGEWELDRADGFLRRLNFLAYVNDVEHGMTNEGKPTAEPDPDRMPPFALDVDVDSEVTVTGGRAASTLNPGEAWTVQLGSDVYSAEKDARRTIRRDDTGDLLFEDLMWPRNTITDAGFWTRVDRNLGTGINLSTALRLDVVSAEADTASDFYLANTSGSLDQDETNLSGATTVSVNLSSRWNVSLGVGTVVRTADATERYSDRIPASKAQISAEFMGNPDLDPERSTQADLWVEGRYQDWSLDVNGFVRRIDDYITLEETDLPPRLPLSPPTVYRYVNGTAEFFGFEIGGGYAFTDAFSANAGLDYLWGQDVTLDEPALGVAPLRTDFGLRYEVVDAGYFAEGSVTAVAEQDRLSTTRGETEPTPGYAVVDLQGGFEVFPGLQLRGGVNNLLDKHYHQHLNSKNPFTGRSVPEPGRVIFVRATYSF